MYFYPKLLVLVAVLIQTSYSQEDVDGEIVQSVNSFALDMYRVLSKKPGNVFFSPFSIFTALSMTSLGAKKNTLRQMLKVMNVDKYDKGVIHQWFRHFSHELLNKKKQQNYTLSIVSKLYGDKNYIILGKFMKDNLKYYKARFQKMDFRINYERSRKSINKWVSHKTKDKINDILTPGKINHYTKVVLVNAIYFKGNWLSQFSADNTMESNFYINKNDVVKVSMMYRKIKLNFAYSNSLKSQVLELPYKGESLSMVVILPRLDETTVAELEKSITPSILSSFSFYKKEVEVYLPKFKIESTFNMKDKLQQMGMKDLFSEEKADLSGMNGKRNLYISSVVHKAYVEVNEEGSEAAAATVAVSGFRSMPIVPRFIANHPFLFYIRDNKSNSIIFFGKFNNPQLT